MNTTSATNTALQSPNPQIIRITYPRSIGDNNNSHHLRKPDEQSLEQRLSSFLVCPPQTSTTSSASATVPQIVNILNPVVSTVATSNANGMLPNAKKCTFHRQCLHVQQTGQQQQQQHMQNVSQSHQQQLQQNFMPLQTPSSSQLLHPQQQILQQQQQQQLQVRISNNQIPASNNNPAVNRNSTQANRDAISTNIQPQLNAALLQDRYLLLDMVDGSSFYKCIDIQTQKLLVCKVFIYLFHYIFFFFSINFFS